MRSLTFTLINLLWLSGISLAQIHTVADLFQAPTADHYQTIEQKIDAFLLNITSNHHKSSNPREAIYRQMEDLITGERVDRIISSVWVALDSFQYTYTTDNLPYELIWLKKQEDSWIQYWRIFLEYDENQNVTTFTFQDGEGLEWINDDRIIFEYDEENNLTHQIDQTWVDTFWVTNYRVLYTYHNTNQTEQTYQSLEDSIWMTNGRILLDYNDQELLVMETYQSWIDSSWNNLERYSITYNNDQNITLELRQSFEDSIWVDNSKNIYEYDANQNLILENWQYFIDGLLHSNRQSIYTYDANQNLVHCLTQQEEDSIWINDRQYRDSFDLNHNMVLRTLQDWTPNEGWIDEIRFSSEYDDNYNLIFRKWQSWEFNEWINTNRRFYYYQGTLTNTTQPTQDLQVLNVFPNPNNGQFNIDLADQYIHQGKLSLFDQSGNMVYHADIQNIHGSITVDFLELPAGSYFLRLQSSNLNAIQQLIIIE